MSDIIKLMIVTESFAFVLSGILPKMSVYVDLYCLSGILLPTYLADEIIDFFLFFSVLLKRMIPKLMLIVSILLGFFSVFLCLNNSKMVNF